MTQPLDGIRVIEVDNWGFAPSAGTVLGDWGAEVIKVEDPSRGDPLRGIFGTISFAEGAMINFLHEQWNRNKRSVGIDLTADTGREALDELIAGADVFLTNYLPGPRERFRLRSEDVRGVNSSIVYALATGQGSKGPDAAKPSFDYISAWARAGVGERLTPAGAPLVNQRAGTCDTTGGNFLAGAIAAALVRRERTGEGSDVEVSLLATGAWMMGPDIANVLLNDFELPQNGADGRGAGPLTTWYECADGKRIVFVMMNVEHYWPLVCDALGLDWLLTDERFDTPEKRAAEPDALHQVLTETIATRARPEWAERLAESEVVWAPVQSPSEYIEDVQVEANGYLLEIDDDERGVVRLVSSPAQFDGEPIVGRRVAPDLGQDTDHVLAAIGWDADRIAAARKTGAIG